MSESPHKAKQTPVKDEHGSFLRACKTCDVCGEIERIDSIYVCDKCNRMICERCKGYLSRHSREVNFDFHYCASATNASGDNSTINQTPGNLVLLYNGQLW